MEREERLRELDTFFDDVDFGNDRYAPKIEAGFREILEEAMEKGFTIGHSECHRETGQGGVTMMRNFVHHFRRKGLEPYVFFLSSCYSATQPMSAWYFIPQTRFLMMIEGIRDADIVYIHGDEGLEEQRENVYSKIRERIYWSDGPRDRYDCVLGIFMDPVLNYAFDDTYKKTNLDGLPFFRLRVDDGQDIRTIRVGDKIYPQTYGEI